MATLVQAAPAQNGASSHPYTCNTCQVAFRSSDLQRTHMQSDWHRYNLKRRVASLPPLASEVFAEKVLANKASAAATAARAQFEKQCEACDRTYYSEGAYVNHLGSQKHRILDAKMRARAGNETESLVDSTFSLGEAMEGASTTTAESTVLDDDEHVDREAGEEFVEVVQAMKATGLDQQNASARQRPSRPTPSVARHQVQHPLSPTSEREDSEGEENYEHKADLQQCLFCNYSSPTNELNLTHMNRQHGFFVPERDYLVDLNGLVNYLSETIHVLHQCLFCHKSVHTTAGVQTHMRDRGHCMIAYDTEEEQMEVGEFYDFRSTYSDEEDDEEDTNGGVKLGGKRATKTTVQNADGEEVDMNDDEDGWESDSTLSSVPTDEITSVPIEHDAKLDLNRHRSHTDSKTHKNTDGFHSHAHSHGSHAVYHDEYELHLPSGRTAGHRSLRTYYKQNLRNYPTPEERAEQRTLENGRHDSDAENESDDDDTRSATTETNDRDRGRAIVSRANGGLGMVGVSDVTKRQVRTIEKREQKRQQRAQNRYQAGNERRGNFQKHFRDPLLQ